MVFKKGVLKICSKFTGGHPCRSVISIRQLYWNRISACVFTCKFAAYFQNTFFTEHLWKAVSVNQKTIYKYHLEVYSEPSQRSKKKFFKKIHAFLYATLFFNSASVLPKFSWIELQMLLRCYLIHNSIILLKHFLYLLNLGPWLNRGLFMSYLCHLFFIFISFSLWLIV